MRVEVRGQLVPLLLPYHAGPWLPSQVVRLGDKVPLPTSHLISLRNNIIKYWFDAGVVTHAWHKDCHKFEANLGYIVNSRPAWNKN